MASFPQEKNKYNLYKTVHLFFYTIENNKIKLLLKKHAEENHFSEITTQVTDLDVSPVLSISRILSSDFKGLFSNSNLRLLYQKTRLTGEHLKPLLPWYKLNKDDTFLEWLFNLTENVVQYDSFEGKMIYFYELKEIDVDCLNCLKGETNYEFKYFNYHFQNVNDEHTISTKTKALMKLLNFTEHILYTKNLLNDDSLVNRYLILSCNDKRYEDGLHYILRRAVFQGLYKSNNERWSYYTADDELPCEDILNKTNTILIPGSCLHLYDNPYGKEKIKEFLIKIINDYKHIKLVGFCYGHQMLSYALGGSVGSMEKTIAYVEDIEIDETFWELGFVVRSGVEKRKTISVFEIHSDEVTLMPKDMVLYGSSKTCKNEIFVSKDKRIFSIQGHPEYSPEYMFFRLYSMVFSHLGDSKEDIPKYEKIKEEWLAKLRNKDIEIDFRRIFYSFMKE
jgi:GMP synthase-like glutamine amidotransferase